MSKVIRRGSNKRFVTEMALLELKNVKKGKKRNFSNVTRAGWKILFSYFYKLTQQGIEKTGISRNGQNSKSQLFRLKTPVKTLKRCFE